MIASEIREYVAIVEHGSVSEAARQLDIPRATLSRRLAALEDELGVTLLHRETRRLAMTQAGEELYRKALKIVADIEETEVAVRALDGVPRGVLKVSVPPAIGPRLSTFIIDFLEKYPEVSIDLVATSRHVDLVGEGIDVAIRGGMVRDPGLMARRVMRSEVVVVAAPSLVERLGPIETLEDFERVPCVRVYQQGWKPVDEYPLRDGGTVRVKGRVRSNELPLTRDLVLKGFTAAMIPGEFVHADVKSGAMVVLLPEILGAEGAVSIVWPQADHLDPKVRAFIDEAVVLFESWEIGDWTQ